MAGVDRRRSVTTCCARAFRKSPGAKNPRRFRDARLIFTVAAPTFCETIVTLGTATAISLLRRIQRTTTYPTCTGAPSAVSVLR